MNLRQKFSLQNQISLSNSGKVDRRWIVPGDVPASRPIKNSTLDRHRIPTLGPDSVSRRAILILGLGLILSISIVFFTKNQHKEDVTNVAEFNTLERDDGYRASIEKEANIVTITLREPKALIHTDNKNSTHKNVSVSNKNNSP
ncbi:MAG: hypothetical protein OEZ58_17190, partial [Gammaproteobacteria bacterium]|nr:hypothetical protein [Gammaproteobacteria bacterium]